MVPEGTEKANTEQRSVPHSKTITQRALPKASIGLSKESPDAQLHTPQHARELVDVLCSGICIASLLNKATH